jgi:hypothetical protein
MLSFDSHQPSILAIEMYVCIKREDETEKKKYDFIDVIQNRINIDIWLWSKYWFLSSHKEDLEAKNHSRYQSEFFFISLVCTILLLFLCAGVMQSNLNFKIRILSLSSIISSWLLFVLKSFSMKPIYFTFIQFQLIFMSQITFIQLIFINWKTFGTHKVRVCYI